MEPENKDVPVVSSESQPQPVNQNEIKELTMMRQQMDQTRFQLGLHEEKIEELKNDKASVARALSQQKQTFLSRIATMAKSYGLELGVVKDGVIWQFNETSNCFVPQKVK